MQVENREIIQIVQEIYIWEFKGVRSRCSVQRHRRGPFPRLFITTDPSGQVIASDAYTLNLDGNRAAVDEVDGTTARHIEYTYDADGRLIEEFDHAPNVSDTTTFYTYNLDGNRASMASTLTTYGYTSGVTTSSQSYTYDADGRLTLSAGYENGTPNGPNGDPVSTIYTYGNKKGSGAVLHFHVRASVLSRPFGS